MSESSRINLNEFRLYSASCSLQINENEMFIFGGYDIEMEGNRLSYVLKQ
jgi:hypothetical protein